MSWFRYFRRRHWDDERARELESYLAIEIDDNLARGLAPDEARRAAYRTLGNPTLIREEIYRMNTLGFIETIWQDLRYGARLLRANPTFAVVAIATLALGTGANTAIFELVDAVRLRTLPVHEPQQLVEIGIDTHDKGRTGRFLSRRPRLTDPILQQIEEQQQVFSGIAAWGSVTFDLASGGESRPADGLYVNGTFFETLGVSAQIGRVLAPADDRRGCTSPAVVLSDPFWRREYGADPGVLGRTLSLDGHAYQIVGVAPRSFFGLDVGRSFDVMAPLCSEPLSRGRAIGAWRSRRVVPRRARPPEARRPRVTGRGAARRALAGDLRGDRSRDVHARRSEELRRLHADGDASRHRASRCFAPLTNRRCGCCWGSRHWSC